MSQVRDLYGLDDYSLIGQLRLFDAAGLFLFKNHVCEKAAFPPEVHIFDRAYQKLEENGMLARDFEATIILTPPLCLTKDDADEIIDRMDRVVGGLAKDLGY